MSTSIDYGTLTIGALIGVGCREQLKSAAKVAATTAASLASSVAVAVNSAAAQMYDQSGTQTGQQGGTTTTQGTNGNQEKEKMKFQYEMTPEELEYVICIIMRLMKEKNRMHLD